MRAALVFHARALFYLFARQILKCEGFLREGAAFDRAFADDGVLGVSGEIEDLGFWAGFGEVLN
jgi:hypothetical protein